MCTILHGMNIMSLETKQLKNKNLLDKKMLKSAFKQNHQNGANID